jgi:hypothetical protein
MPSAYKTPENKTISHRKLVLQQQEKLAFGAESDSLSAQG